jgi:hypothetical protein
MRWVNGAKIDFSEAEFGSVYWIDPPLVVVELLVFQSLFIFWFCYDMVNQLLHSY